MRHTVSFTAAECPRWLHPGRLVELDGERLLVMRTREGDGTVTLSLVPEQEWTDVNTAAPLFTSPLLPEPGESLHDLFQRIRKHAVKPTQTATHPDGDRYQDIAIAWRRRATGEILLSVGGRWDRVERRYSGPATDVKVIDLIESQVEAARILTRWITEAQAGRPSDFRGLFLHGDRRSGKRTLGGVAMLTLLVAFPLTAGWHVYPYTCPIETAREEFDRLIRQNLPAPWYRYVEGDRRYELVTGSTLTHLADVDPRLLKGRRAGFVLFSDPERLDKAAVFNALGGLKDRLGLALFTGNPPDDKSPHWISDLAQAFAASTDKGRAFPLRFFRLDVVSGEAFYAEFRRWHTVRCLALPWVMITPQTLSSTSPARFVRGSRGSGWVPGGEETFEVSTAEGHHLRAKREIFDQILSLSGERGASVGVLIERRDQHGTAPPDHLRAAMARGEICEPFTVPWIVAVESIPGREKQETLA